MAGCIVFVFNHAFASIVSLLPTREMFEVVFSMICGLSGLPNNVWDENTFQSFQVNAAK